MRACVRGRLDLDLEFAPRAFRLYNEAELSHQLNQLATVTWTRYRREYLEVENAFLDWSVQEVDPHDELFEELAEKLAVHGSSPAGWVTVHSRALVRWDFHLVPGVLQRLTEQRFVGEAVGAAANTIRAYRARRARLLDEFYDLAAGLPPWVRERTGGADTRPEGRIGRDGG
jgi:hypothetical protein